MCHGSVFRGQTRLGAAGDGGRVPLGGATGLLELDHRSRFSRSYHYLTPMIQPARICHSIAERPGGVDSDFGGSVSIIHAVYRATTTADADASASTVDTGYDLEMWCCAVVWDYKIFYDTVTRAASVNSGCPARTEFGAFYRASSLWMTYRARSSICNAVLRSYFHTFEVADLCASWIFNYRGVFGRRSARYVRAEYQPWECGIIRSSPGVCNCRYRFLA